MMEENGRTDCLSASLFLCVIAEGEKKKTKKKKLMTILNNDAIPLHPSLTCCSSLAASALVYNQQSRLTVFFLVSSTEH